MKYKKCESRFQSDGWQKRSENILALFAVIFILMLTVVLFAFNLSFGSKGTPMQVIGDQLSETNIVEVEDFQELTDLIDLYIIVDRKSEYRFLIVTKPSSIAIERIPK